MSFSILFLSNTPAPYTVAYLNELGKIAKIKAVFEKLGSPARDDSWKSFSALGFTYTILKGIPCGDDSAFSPQVINYLKKNTYNAIVIHNPATPTGVTAILYCKLFRIPFILQSEGGIPKDGKGIKERFKKWLMKSAKLYLSGMNPEHDYFLTYGAKKEEIVQFPFTSLYQKDIVKKIPSCEEKKKLRAELGIEADAMILFVGQFIHRKGIDILLNAAKNLPGDPYILIVGGEPTEEYREIIRDNGLLNVHFCAFMSREELAKYYLASDIFVLPTREDTWGLVVNEAMAAGLPVITTMNCVAGRELVENGVNGYLVETENAEALHCAMEDLLLDAEKRYQMGVSSLKRIQPYSYENMAKVIYTGLLANEEK